jgi:bisphosphoglycerate-independent phosphoglycerate mutase (AlkP superfamily)
LKAFEDKFAALGKGRVASIIGRYYAMDRDNRWDRVEQAYDLMTLAKASSSLRPPLKVWKRLTPVMKTTNS